MRALSTDSPSFSFSTSAASSSPPSSAPFPVPLDLDLDLGALAVGLPLPKNSSHTPRALAASSASLASFSPAFLRALRAFSSLADFSHAGREESVPDVTREFMRVIRRGSSVNDIWGMWDRMAGSEPLVDLYASMISAFSSSEPVTDQFQ